MTKFNVINKNVSKTEMHALCEVQEKSDNRTFYATNINHAVDMVIRWLGTNRLIILLGNMLHMTKNIKIFIQIGTGKKKNKLKCPSYNQIHA